MQFWGVVYCGMMGDLKVYCNLSAYTGCAEDKLPSRWDCLRRSPSRLNAMSCVEPALLYSRN